jgi:hypothetical protein
MSGASPDIFLSDPKEPDFFADPEPATARAAYLSLFTGGAEQRWRGESSDRMAAARLDALATLHEQDIYRRFMWARRLHHPDLVRAWISGSLFYCRHSLPRHLLNL